MFLLYVAAPATHAKKAWVDRLDLFFHFFV